MLTVFHLWTTDLANYPSKCSEISCYIPRMILTWLRYIIPLMVLLAGILFRTFAALYRTWSIAFSPIQYCVVVTVPSRQEHWSGLPFPSGSQGPGEPGGLPSMGSHRVGHDFSPHYEFIFKHLMSCYLLAVPGLNCSMQDLWSSLHHSGSLVATCELLVAACGI